VRCLAFVWISPGLLDSDAIDQCFTAHANKTSSQWILEGDIRACFDEISHSWWLTNVPTDTVILQKSLMAGYIEDRQFSPTSPGPPKAASFHERFRIGRSVACNTD